MRERTLGLTVQGGDAVSAEYLAYTLHQRAQSLVDDPSTALFFGRTDHTTASAGTSDAGTSPTRRATPVVVDWRADVSRAFYRASRAEPMGVDRRRRFGIERGQHHRLRGRAPHRPGGDRARAARSSPAEIERPRVGPMRDIVATIQPEQDEIVRAGAATTVCVQGAPGTGKTAVGLHRAAWLLYAHRDKLARSGVLVVGPEPRVPRARRAPSCRASARSRCGTRRSRTSWPARRHAAPRTTGSGRCARGDPGPGGGPRRPSPSSRATPGWRGPARAPSGRTWREPEEAARAAPRLAAVAAAGVPGPQEIVEELRGAAPATRAARDMLAQRLAHAILVLMEEAGDSPDDRVQDAVARSREVRRYVDLGVARARAAGGAVPALHGRRRSWSRAPEGVLDGRRAEARCCGSRRPRSRASARWSPADVVLLDELADLLRRTPSLGHVVLDEAQDLSPMQLRAVGRRCSTGAATVLGDIAQGTTPWATPSWDVALSHLGHPEAHLEVLDRGFRVPAAVIAFAARLLPVIAPGMSAPTSVRDDPGSLARSMPVDGSGLWPGDARRRPVGLGRRGVGRPHRAGRVGRPRRSGR